MDQVILILIIAAFGASALQSATGIGFGVIAGPALLIALNDGSAIQISVLLNLLIALLLGPSLWQKFDRQLLKFLFIGLAIGTPLGLYIYLHMNIALLKLFAGLTVLLTLLMVVRGNRASSPAQTAAPGIVERITDGVVSVIMCVSLSMPVPVPATSRLPRRGTPLFWRPSR